MDVAFVIRQRLRELGLEQKVLARAARVTESYISQLLGGKRAPPVPGRTDIYDRMDRILKLPEGELARIADFQRKDELKRELGEKPAPLFPKARALILGKCKPAKQRQVRAVFEAQPFGELERLVTQTLLDVAKRVAGPRGPDTDIFHLSDERRMAVLGPLVASWDVDLATFELEIVLKRRVAAQQVRRFEFVERRTGPTREEPGLREFLNDKSLSGGVTADELEFLRGLRFGARRPTAYYFYREMQSLRDPLHFSYTSHTVRWPP